VAAAELRIYLDGAALPPVTIPLLSAPCERIGAKVRNISATGAQFPKAAVESLGRDLDALADRAQKEQSFVKRARRVSVAVA